MKSFHNIPDIPPEGIDTPYGYLYYPPPQGKQILFLVASFLSAIILGLLIGSILGDLSSFATGVICFVFLLVFFLGYGLWISLVSALVFSSIKWPLIKIISKFFLRKEKTRSLNELLPEREKIIELLVRAQKYSKTFFILSWPIGFVGGLLTLLMQTSTSPVILYLLIISGSAIYGFLLSYFGRRGYLLFPEE